MASSSSATTSKKRKCFSLEMKAQIIDEVEKGIKTKAQICRENDISSGSLYTILKNKDSVTKALNKGSFQPDRKRIRTTGLEDVDQALLKWFKQARSNSVPISGPILQAKGEELAKSLGLSDFKMSGGWLDRFKSRHGIGMKNVCGESASAPIEDSANWRQTELQKILEEYSPEDVFNADETGLYYKCLPNKTLATKGEACSGQKVPKDRITILVAANMDGSEKLRLLVIGKFREPHCLRGIRTYPVTYRWNKKAWMTGVIFEEWVRQLDKKFLLQGRSIALILDNCSAHPRLTGLKAIRLIFLPPNTTSVLQPCDQGIIQNLKIKYRQRVLRHFISTFDNTGSTGSHFKMSLLQAFNMVSEAWYEVEPKTIVNCFRKAGFTRSDTQTTEMDDQSQPEQNQLRNLFERFQTILPEPVESTVDDYVDVDNNTDTSQELTTDEIVSHVIEERQNETETVEEDEDEDEIVPTVTSRSVEQSLDNIRLFLQQRANTTDKLKQLTAFERSIQTMICHSKKQTTMESFFKSSAERSDNHQV